MILATNANGYRIPAMPGLQAHCDICDGKVVPKCGQIVVWHWAHETVQDCDPWAEPVTQWHADWEAKFPVECREVRIGNHRADIRLPNDRIIELQHSGISVDEIEEREKFYGNMAWIFDAVDAAEKGRLDLRIKDWTAAPGLKHCSFRWRYPRRSVFFCHKPVFFDIGNGQLLHLRRLYPKAPHGGWGTIYPVDRFLSDCGVITSLAIGAVSDDQSHDWSR